MAPAVWSRKFSLPAEMSTLLFRHCLVTPPKILRTSVSLAFVALCLSLTSCGHVQRDSAENASGAKPVLAAEPNPVPAGDPDRALGTTVISWNTGREAAGDLYVKVNRSPEVHLAHAASGTLKIDWIQFDSTYEFRLYAGKKRSKLLAQLDVTRDN